jgi:WD40 repeat protein
VQTKKIKFINEIISNDKNDIQNKILIKSMVKKNVDDNFLSTAWCMKKLNDIQINKNQKLELIGVGSGRKILLFNILNFKIYQIINEHNGTVYSLDQYENDINYLFSSSNDSTINIYKFTSDFKYGLIQKLKKSSDKAGGEINKVVCLSNKLLVCGDHRSITIWKNNSKETKRIYYEDIYEIIVNKDTCHILEANPSIFVATQYTEHHFQVYKNDGKNFPLLGELKNVKTHGISSNGLSKISDKLVCSVGETEFNIICVEPLQVIQKFQINQYISLYYIYATKDKYVYCKSDINTFIQYKIIYDEDNNFVELVEIGRYLCAYLRDKAIAPLEDGRIFFTEEKEGEEYYQMIA